MTTMVTISRDVCDEAQDGSLCAEASTLGFGVGVWPDRTTVSGAWREAFYKNHPIETDGGEFGGYVYINEGGTPLTVFND